MKCVVQRVTRAHVDIDDQIVGSINHGILVLVGITDTDTEEEADWIADKLLHLRIFPDDEGKMNRNVQEVEGGILLVSQFTLYGDLKKGTRPSYVKASKPHHSKPLFEYLVQRVRDGAKQTTPVETGVFGAMMDVELINDGPVTIIVER